DIAQLLAVDDAEHVGDVGVEVDGATDEMRAFAEPGVGGGEHLVAGGSEQRPHLLPGPARRPGPVADQTRRHSAPCPPRFQPGASLAWAGDHAATATRRGRTDSLSPLAGRGRGRVHLYRSPQA